MNMKALKMFLQDSLQTEFPALQKEKTIALCTDLVQGYSETTNEPRTGFLRLLFDVLRFEGSTIVSLQVLTLFLVCLITSGLTDPLQFLPVFISLFVLAALPVLLKSQYYKMNELEAATRSSATQLILAKFILISLANLTCMAVLLYFLYFFQHSGRELKELVLYCLVPYLICMTVLLHSFRVCSKKRIVTCTSVSFAFCIGWGILAKVLPWLYELSAFGVWVAAFLIFIVFYIREFLFIIKKGKEGDIYGTIA